MNVRTATAEYEAWLRTFTPLDDVELAYKHKHMADPDDPFPFFRGTYYRWASLWPKACPKLADAPMVSSIGDLHIENFGTWRDAEGRLVWGVNDFDEASELPCTSDLVRLATSARLARRAWPIRLKTGAICSAILSGYRENLEAGGEPFVLEERHPELRALAMKRERNPVEFWAKLTNVLGEAPVDPPTTARTALIEELPTGADVQFRFRRRVGMGSLGKPRYLALADWAGGWLAREAKTLTPAATAWLAGDARRPPIAESLARAVRCPDPYFRVNGDWIIRRLGPRCSRIELALLTASKDFDMLLRSMGAEAANVHLGSPASQSILADLERRPSGWLDDAARAMGQATKDDWAEWRAGYRNSG